MPETRRCYVTVMFEFEAYSDEDERCKREEIHGDVEDTAQRNNTFINHWETHDENMLAEAPSMFSDSMADPAEYLPS